MVQAFPLKWDKEFLLLSLLFLVLPLIGNPDGAVKGLTAVGLLGGCCMIGCTIRLFHCRRLEFTRPDLLFMAWIGWNILGILFVRDFLPDRLPVMENIAWILLYIWLRGKGNITAVLPVILLSASIQAVIAILQKQGLLPGNTPEFPVTGSFGNPAVLGGFLMIGLLLCIALWQQLTGVIGKIAWILLILVIGYGCICADSRAAWMGLSAGGIGEIIARYPYRWKRHHWGSLLILLGIMAGIAALYLYRKGSADGRLLIWQVSGYLFGQSPLTGHGPFSFPEHYMIAQADYLSSFPEAYGWRQAGNNFLAFNEYLRLLCEQGLIGSMLFFIFLGSLWSKNCLEGERKQVFKVISIGWLVFACFSYPANMMPMVLVFIVLSAGMVETSGKKVVWKIALGNRTKGMIGLLTVGILCMGGWGIVRYKGAAERLGIARIHSGMLVGEVLKADYRLLRRNADYVSAYAWALYRAGLYKQAIPVLEQAAQLRPSADIFRDLGNCYVRYGKRDEAEKAYRAAVRMLPAYMEHLYYLFVFYLEAGETEKAREQALKLNRMKPLRWNTITLKIRSRIREFLSAGESHGDVKQELSNNLLHKVYRKEV